MYKTINGWTKQSMIEHIETEFKGKSITSSGSCRYRIGDGKKCAIGMFIPDDKYSKAMEGCINISELSEKYEISFPLHPSLMRQLQIIHDSSPTDNCLTNMLAWIENNVVE